MDETEARANLGKTVYYVPDKLPTSITRETRLPCGNLAELMTSETKEQGKRLKAVVNHETVLLDALVGVDITIADHRTAYTQEYSRRRIAAAAEVAKLAALEDSVDIIDDPEPPSEPKE